MLFIHQIQEVPIAIFPHLGSLKNPAQSKALLSGAAVATSRVEVVKIRHNLIRDLAKQSELHLLALYAMPNVGYPCTYHFIYRSDDFFSTTQAFKSYTAGTCSCEAIVTHSR